jgi:hypothetical protein
MKKLTLILSLLFISVFSNAQVQIDSIIVTNVSCFGGCDASLTVFTSGGTGTETFNIGGTSQNFNSFNGLCSSTSLLTVTVFDANGDSAFTTTQITQPNQLTGNINTPNTICYNEQFQLFANANGGTPPYSFNWFGALNGSGQGPFLDTLTTSAQYNLIVTDNNGCSSGQHVHLVSVFPQPSFTISNVDICSGDTGTLTPTNITGGNPNNPYYFLWMGVDSSSVPPIDTLFGISNTYSDNPDSTTTYCVYIDNVCSLSDTLCVNMNVNTCTSISDETQNNFTTVYPNPTNGIINIKFNQAIMSPINIEILDISGKVIQESIVKVNNPTIDISALPKGVYILNNKENSLHQRIILE